ncbi:pectate lyase [Pseudomonas sp. PIC25]|uniref:pectate lyase n=1 Tax=Pseudomonas sp. PIC25 TaxID=1958773 RepID=UPI001C497135|nr:pectate lyase [Pseudomonas sp. PIC25]
MKYKVLIGCCLYLLGTSLSFAAPKVALKVSQSASTVNLNWTTSGEFVAQEIYRNTQSGSSGRQLVAKLDVSKRSYTDKPGNLSQQYWYWVKVIDASKKSKLSNSASTSVVATGSAASSPSNTPTAPKASAPADNVPSISPAPVASSSSSLLMTLKSADSVNLSWSADGQFVHQIVYRSAKADKSAAVKIAVLDDSNERTFIDHPENLNQDYWYWVVFVATDGSLSESNLAGTSTAAQAKAVRKADSACYAGAVVENATIDCGGITLGTSCPSDSDKQQPLIILKNATVKNLRIAANGGADGIHCVAGDCRIENVVWEDVCEDAASNIKATKSLTIVGGIANNEKNGYGGKPDKIFQHNSMNSKTIVKSGFIASGANGKVWRSCGNCSNNGGPRMVEIDGVKVNGTIGTIAGVNRNYKDVATIRNLKIKDYKEGKPVVCEEFEGVQKSEKRESPSYNEEGAWATTACNVKRSDVSAL